MLIVTNQATTRISREAGFTCAGQTKEERNITPLAYIGGAVHRQNALGGQNKIEHSKYGFFHFTSIMRASNQHKALLKVNDNGSFGACSMNAGVGVKIRDTQHC